MHQFSRRRLLGTTMLVLPVLAACGTSGSSSTPQQIVSGVQGAINTLRVLLPILAAVVPTQVGNIDTLESALTNIALPAAQQISVAMKAVDAATTIQTKIEASLTEAVRVISFVTPAAAAAVPSLSPYVPYVQAAAAILPIVLDFVNATLNPPAQTVAGRAAVSARARAVAFTMTPEQAVAQLNTPVPPLQAAPAKLSPKHR